MISGDTLKRWFAIIGHRTPSTGDLNLNDLPGSGGRLDVLARAVNAALFVSHGIREGSNVILHLLGGGGPNRRVLFDGSELRGLRPDERSIAGQVKSVIRIPVPPIGRFQQVSSGISHSGGGLEQTLKEWRSSGIMPFILDPNGDPATSIPESDDIGFFLSDDSAFTEEDSAILEGVPSISLGKGWLQGHTCIGILHYLMDRS